MCNGSLARVADAVQLNSLPCVFPPCPAECSSDGPPVIAELRWWSRTTSCGAVRAASTSATRGCGCGCRQIALRARWWRHSAVCGVCGSAWRPPRAFSHSSLAGRLSCLENCPTFLPRSGQTQNCKLSTVRPARTLIARRGASLSLRSLAQGRLSLISRALALSLLAPPPPHLAGLPKRQQRD